MFRWDYWNEDVNKNVRQADARSAQPLRSSLPTPSLGMSAIEGTEEERRWKDDYGIDLSPESFQNYLLDLVTLTGIYTPVGHYRNEGETPVDNWLRTQGVTIVFIDSGEYLETRYLSHERAEENIALPEYLYRYLLLLDDDTFPQEVVPAYQALALLSYIITTERYLARGS